MRIVVDPIFVSADGKPARGYGVGSLYSLMILDSGKLNAAGITEALKYESPDFLAFVLGGLLGRNVPAFPYSADLFSKTGLNEYKTQVIDTGNQSNVNHIRDRLDKVLEQARQFPEQFAQNFEPNPDNDNNARRRTKLEQAIGALPSYLRDPFIHENVTIVTARAISRFEPRSENELHLKTSHQATFIPGNSRIGIASDFLDRASPEGLKLAIKEEVLHYWDMQTETSSSPKFVTAAKALLADPLQISVIDQLCGEALKEAKLNHDTKPNLGQYSEIAARMELLANYFHIRDYLFKKNREQKPASFTALTAGGDTAAVDKQMQGLFGPEIYRICKQFEAQLKEKASQIPTGAKITS